MASDQDLTGSAAGHAHLAPAGEFDLAWLWSALWDGKFIVLAVTGVFVAATVVYCVTAKEWYRSEVLLAPAGDGSQTGSAAGLLGQLGGLASIAGFSLGSEDTVEPLAVLSSREFAREFIEDQKLLPVLFADKWNEREGRWRESNRDDWPDYRDGVSFFDDKVRRVREDANTGLVTLTIEWTDPDVAAQWANLIVSRLNERMRQKALVAAEENIAYLREELEKTNLVPLQQSIGRLLEAEFQKRMLARGNKEYSFTIIDPAQPAKEPSKPMRLLLIAMATIIGGALSMFVVLVRYSAGRSRKA
jgi:uncharacterized protein involved in exopolysaccharide biosynthesis